MQKCDTHLYLSAKGDRWSLIVNHDRELCPCVIPRLIAPRVWPCPWISISVCQGRCTLVLYSLTEFDRDMWIEEILTDILALLGLLIYNYIWKIVFNRENYCISRHSVFFFSKLQNSNLYPDTDNKMIRNYKYLNYIQRYYSNTRIINIDSKFYRNRK